MPTLQHRLSGRQRATFEPACFLPYEDRLQFLYGDTPHRISHLTAMSMAGVAIKSGLALNVSGPPVDLDLARKLKVVHREESEDTLLEGAGPWNGPTWVSQPERALLECLRTDDMLPNGEAVAATVMFQGRAVDASAAISLAQQMGWDEPLRRLASIATRMDTCRDVFRVMPNGFLHDDQRIFLEVNEAPFDSDWICVTPTYHDPPPNGDAFRDEKYRVAWCRAHPHMLLEDLLY